MLAESLARYPDLATRIAQDYKEVARVGTARVYVAKTRLRAGYPRPRTRISQR